MPHSAHGVFTVLTNHVRIATDATVPSQLARGINAAQGQAMDQTKRYQSLQQLRALPVTPDGFRVRLYSDGEGYIFSIKDERDACRYGIFSDQHGTLYESSPIVPQIAS